MSKAGPLSYTKKLENYQAQNGDRTNLTPRQHRQLRRTDRRDLAAAIQVLREKLGAQKENNVEPA